MRGILTILLICLAMNVAAQNTTAGKTENIEVTETSSNGDVAADGFIPALTEFQAPEYRLPPEEKIEEFREDNRFRYDIELYKASWWERFKSWLADMLGSVLTSGTTWGIMGYVFIFVLILVIVLIILKLAGVNVGTMIGRKKLDAPSIDIYSENVHEMDFDTLISNALKNKDYRLVVRFMYLKNLKALADKEFIKWNETKTNSSYQYEIQDNALRDRFLDTTFIFDYVWYGEFPIDENGFSKAYSELDEFNKLVSR
ncbi:hypothetical protein [Dysgonomonas sp. 25]|uniref:hypothetical protein n=1 Tax=Dysgonomonas sp. 25 TaxID=2302933 RepID=UPI0013D1B285|nr:hypothetical protein [Dysgonomonas sp. 25]NDV70328.1 hypothetical protein [Dysgonomonas sp. 25]